MRAASESSEGESEWNRGESVGGIGGKGYPISGWGDRGAFRKREASGKPVKEGAAGLGCSHCGERSRDSL